MANLPTLAQKVESLKLSEDDSWSSWLIWKARAEAAGLPRVLSNTAVTLLWLALGNNCWREK